MFVLLFNCPVLIAFQERLSDMDDDELDEYITKGVGDDDDGKNKKNKRLGAPDVAGIDR